MTILESHHGIILNENLPAIFVRRTLSKLKAGKYSLAWPGFTEKDSSINYPYELMMAKTSEEVFNSVKNVITPA